MLASLQQLRDRDPTATVTSDLLTVQSDRFVVKVTIHTQGLGAVSALAADAVIEAAEDRALQRALRGLGIAGATLPEARQTSIIDTSQTSLPEESVSVSADFLASPAPMMTEPVVVSSSMLTTSTQGTAPDSKPLPTLPKPAKATPQTSTQSTAPDPTSLPAPPPWAETTPQIPPNGQASHTIESSPITEFSGTLPAPINLSDVIAQTDVELRRLNWSVADGRDYLTSTYGKRSRHDLTDEELLAFLLHLEALPTPSASV